MNILLAMPWDQVHGGVTHVAASLAGSLERRGHRVYFLFQGGNWRLLTRTSRRGFPAIQCRFRDYPSQHAGLRARLSWLSTVFTSLPQLVRFGRTHCIDLINVHYPGSSFSLLVDLAQRLHVPLVVSVHGSDLFPESQPDSDDGVNRLLDHASAVVVPSSTFLRGLVEAYPSVRGKASCIYNGYDEKELAAEPAPRTAPHGRPVALCIATHSYVKGIDVLLKAVHALPAEQLSVRLIGDGELQQQLEELCKRLDLSDRVTFVGLTTRRGVFEELRSCDLFVLPSRSESFGLAALEAMACGKPVVASAVGGLRDLIEHEATGLLVPPDDPDSLALALSRLCTDRALRHRFGEAARMRSKQFTTEPTADQYEQLFTRLVESVKGAEIAPVAEGPRVSPTRSNTERSQ